MGALRRLGWDLTRAIDTHPKGTDDETHFQTAVDQRRILVSHDRDMLAIASRWQAEGKAFPGLIYCRPTKFAVVGDALRALKAAVADQDARPFQGRVHYL